MKKANRILWGIVLVALGVLFALNALEITTIDVFFDGWWTLFIILPCTIGLITEKGKVGNLIGIGIGVFLLLCAQDIIDFSLVWKLLLPVVIVIIGAKMIFSGLFDNKAIKLLSETKKKGATTASGTAVFSGCDLNCEGQIFEGAELTAVFGGVDCDLRRAVIDHDCAIRASSVFGGIDIFVPADINVKVSSVGIFGGVSNKTAARKDAPTLYISAVCVFGGVEVKEE